MVPKHIEAVVQAWIFSLYYNRCIHFLCGNLCVKSCVKMFWKFTIKIILFYDLILICSFTRMGFSRGPLVEIHQTLLAVVQLGTNRGWEETIRDRDSRKQQMVLLKPVAKYGRGFALSLGSGLHRPARRSRRKAPFKCDSFSIWELKELGRQYNLGSIFYRFTDYSLLTNDENKTH